MFCFFIVVAVVLSTVSGQCLVGQNVTGPCSRFQVTNQQSFVPALMVGPWYVYVTYDYPDIVGLDCLSTNFIFNIYGRMRTTLTGRNLTTDARKEILSTYYFTQPNVGFYSLDSADATALKLQIPVADYKSYFIEFTCTDLSNGQADCYIGVFTRLAFPLPAVVTQINNYLDTHNIDRTKLRFVSHNLLRCLI